MKSNILLNDINLKTINNDIIRGIKPIEKTRKGINHNKKYLNFNNNLLLDILNLSLFFPME
jgi:hypothetical protein